MLADVYRLAVLPGVGTHLAALIATGRLSRFLSGTADRYGVDLLAARVELTAERVLALPETARRQLGIGPPSARSWRAGR